MRARYSRLYKTCGFIQMASWPAAPRTKEDTAMEKRVCVKMARLPNVVGRVDYISNPKRQENLLGFYQTPADPEQFWKALSEESQEYAAYNKAQMEEHNRKENERFAAGEIKKRSLLKTVEAREMILALPNDVYGVMDAQIIARLLAMDIKARHGIECAVGVHMNKKGTNFHAHLILPERIMLENIKESIASRNTYFDADGKRSTKQKCVDEQGNLKSGCRLVRKGEVLHQRRFSEKIPTFASKGFSYGEKLRYAKLFNQWSKDRWVVYNHRTNPYLRLYNLVKGEPEALRAWKERENAKIRAYNAAIEKLLDSGELTVAQALKIKEEYYAARAAQRKERQATREAWQLWYANASARRQREYEERRRIMYADSGRKRGLFEMAIILGITIAGVDVLKSDTDVDEDLIVMPRDKIYAKPDQKLQAMVDQLAIAAGRKSPSQLMAERKVKNLALSANRKLSIEEQIAAAEAIGSEGPNLRDGLPARENIPEK